MPRKKKQESTIAEVLDANPQLKVAAELSPPERELVEPEPSTARASNGPESGIELELPTFAEKLAQQRPPMQPVPQGFQNVSRYVEAGISKFVIRPAGLDSPPDFLDAFISELVPLQT